MMANKRKYEETVVGQSQPTQTESGPAEQHADDDPDEAYDMNHAKRGIAVVINQENFYGSDKREGTNEDRDKREGTNKDRDDVCEVLKKLQFDVRDLHDRLKNIPFEELDKIAKEDHTNNDCLVVVVMTHGKTDELYAKDEAYKIDELWNKFTGDSCKTLQGKPKLFFIQACRGTEVDDGVQYVADTVDAIRMQPTSYFSVPTEPDFLVMFSTYDGYLSFRNRINGSWFIQSLCDMLKTYGHEKELLRVLTAVSEKVAYNYISDVPDDGLGAWDKKKQIPTLISMLTKAVYFRPK